MRKNIDGLLKAYGRDRELQKLANLCIVAGKRDNPEDLDSREKAILTQLFILIDAYNLHGKVSLPKYVDYQNEVPELYRMIAHTGGIFVNPAYTEPFGITNLEAAASALPVVSTDNGGPSSVITDGKNGILVDVRDTANIARGIKRLLKNERLWKKVSREGHRNVIDHYTWDVAARTELDIFSDILGRR
jgi:sucrose-phosphate synthase